MPEPRGCLLGEHQRDGVADAEPGAGADQRSVRAGRLESRRAGGAEQRYPLQRLRMTPQIQVGRAAFELVAEEEADAHIAAIEAANGTVGVDFEIQARATGSNCHLPTIALPGWKNRAAQEKGCARRLGPGTLFVVCTFWWEHMELWSRIVLGALLFHRGVRCSVGGGAAQQSHSVRPDGLRAQIVDERTAPTFARLRDEGCELRQQSFALPDLHHGERVGIRHGALPRRHRGFQQLHLHEFRGEVLRRHGHAVPRNRSRAA